MSLCGKLDANIVAGAIHNAQLTFTLFPNWELRVHVDRRHNMPGDFRMTRLVDTLKHLKADVRFVGSNYSSSLLTSDELGSSSCLLHYVDAVDTTVDAVIFRNSNERLKTDDAAAVTRWLQSAMPIHCLRYLSSHAGYPISGGQWGVRPSAFVSLLNGTSLYSVLQAAANAQTPTESFLNKIWSSVEMHTLCVDTISDRKWRNVYDSAVGKGATFGAS